MLTEMEEKQPVRSADSGKSQMHFSDGVLEVNADDGEKVDAPVVNACDPVSPRCLT